jgi:iron complex transport system ATP-binding protein
MMTPNRTSSANTIIHATGVSVIVDKRTIINDVTIDILPGEVLALVGPNGAGKSTLLSVLSGDVTPDAGSVTMGGRDLGGIRHLELARLRSVLTQENQVSFPFTVEEVVEMGRSPWARTPERERDNEVISEALTLTEVAHLADRRYTSLSGGEKARVSLARVLAQSTPVIFLDEPTAALDLRHQEEVMRTARTLAGEGRAVVIVVHDLSLAAAYADRVALIERGSLVALGSPTDVLTEDAIADVYGLRVEVLDQNGRLVVVPRRN